MSKRFGGYSSNRRRRARQRFTTILIVLLALACVALIVIMPNGPLSGILKKVGFDPSASKPTTSPTVVAAAPTAEPQTQSTPVAAPANASATNAAPVVTAEPQPAATEESATTATAEPASAATAEPAAETTPEPVITQAPTAEPEPTPVPTPVALDLPYAVAVDRAAHTVTVYTVGQNGQYDLPVRTMLCATDQYASYPENGTYALNGEKLRWTTSLLGANYAQYATRIDGKVLFQSLPYTEKRPDALDDKAYSMLGNSATTGSVWLLCADAKWLYDNLPAGTPVTFLSGNSGTTLTAPAQSTSGWDPTDPDAMNPAYDDSRTLPEVTPWLGVTPAPTPAWGN